jgi:putative redox protein
MIKVRYIEGTKYELTNGKEILVNDASKYSPVELFLSAMANCSLVDIVELSIHQGFEVSNASIELEFKRRETHPKIFEELHFIYRFSSNADDVKAKRWVLSSLETYCSTINNVRNTSKIYYTIYHNGNAIAFKETIISGNAGESKLESFDDDLEGFGCACCNS